jgi:uncharacterized phage protein gp47/JayE
VTILATVACTIGPNGISRPPYSDIYETFQAQFKAIYGTDAYIDPDSQDGQLLAIIAKAQDDSNAACVAAYNGYSPATAQGAGLSTAVKINGIARAVATHSQVNLTLAGTVGTVISNGVATDNQGQRWLLPASVIIGALGTAAVTATAELEGDIEAAAGTITNIATPTLGWQTVTNPSAAAPGQPVETDAKLRQRQTISVALPSRTVLDGIVGAVAAVSGVSQVRGYENDTNATDTNGIPAHSISIVCLGGASGDIANAMMLKKTPGTGTYGTTSVILTDPGGVPTTINFFVATQRRVVLSLTLKALANYVSTVGDSVKAALAAYINALGIGKKVDFGRLYVPAQLYFGPGSETFEVDSLTIAFFGGGLAAADLFPAFNEIATCDVADITLLVT